MKATDLSIGDIGKTFRSETCRNNNKTTKPTNAVYTRGDGSMYRERERTWTLDTIYAHANGNIKINNDFHLRADTNLERVDND